MFLRSGGLQGGGVNFDAKLRRNSTDLEDLFHAHIGGMDMFARALIVADDILQQSELEQFRTSRYTSFDEGLGKEFELGKLDIQALHDFAVEQGEPKVSSGRQEYLENILNRFI